MGLLFESLANFENENEKLKYLLEQAQASSKFFANEYTRLRSENKKLRECLERYSKNKDYSISIDAREALKEIKE